MTRDSYSCRFLLRGLAVRAHRGYTRGNVPVVRQGVERSAANPETKNLRFSGCSINQILRGDLFLCAQPIQRKNPLGEVQVLKSLRVLNQADVWMLPSRIGRSPLLQGVGRSSPEPERARMTRAVALNRSGRGPLEAPVSYLLHSVFLASVHRSGVRTEVYGALASVCSH